MNTTKGKQRIGRGAFSTVYRETETTVLIVSCDPVKECMAMGWFPDSPLFPKVERLDYNIDSKGRSLYRMDFLTRPRSLKNALSSRDWQLYKDLKDYFLACHPPFERDQSYQVLKQAFQRCLQFFPDVLETLEDAVDSLANYGSDMWFEISPRNLAVKDGKLIFLDCFFMRKKLDELRR